MKKQQANRFGDILKAWVETLEKRSKLDEVLIERLWRKKMGTSINRYTREIKFRKGVVYLTIDSAPLKKELSMNLDRIVSMFNRAFGKEVVTRVVIR